MSIHVEGGRDSLLQLLVLRSNRRDRSQHSEEPSAQLRLDEIAHLPDQDVLELREDCLPKFVVLIQKERFNSAAGEKLPANYRDQGAVPRRRRETVCEVGEILTESLPC